MLIKRLKIVLNNKINDILELSFSSHPEIRELDETETLVTIGDMTYLREVTENDFCNCMCLYFLFDSTAYFLVCLN